MANFIGNIKNVISSSYLYNTLQEFKTKYIDTKANKNHSHNYADSSSPGGSATSAIALTTSSGTSTQPIYFKNGKPVATTYSLKKTVPSNAVFTDTKYPISNKIIDSDFLTQFRTQTKGDSNNGFYLSAIRANSSVSNAPIYGAGIAYGISDTHGYLYTNFSAPEAYIGGGNANKLNWQKRIAFSDDVLPISGGTLTGDVTFKETSAISNKISWNGSTDGADIYYRLDDVDAGRLVFNLRDDTNTCVCMALNGNDFMYIESNGTINMNNGGGKFCNDGNVYINCHGYSNYLTEILNTKLSTGGGTLSGQLRIQSNEMNGGYNGLLVGDDCYIGDCNIANTIGIMGNQNNNIGYIKFGKNGGTIGFNGTSLEVSQSINMYGTAQVKTRHIDGGTLGGMNGDLYLNYNNPNNDIYFGNSGYKISNNGSYYNGDAKGIKSTGFGNTELTYFQTDGAFDGRSGWCHYIVANHGDGESYYHYNLGLPFWGSPIYKRQWDGGNSGWQSFYTTENITYGTSEKIAGQSPLSTGCIYIQYE